MRQLYNKVSTCVNLYYKMDRGWHTCHDNAPVTITLSDSTITSLLREERKKSLMNPVKDFLSVKVIVAMSFIKKKSLLNVVRHIQEQEAHSDLWIVNNRNSLLCAEQSTSRTFTNISTSHSTSRSTSTSTSTTSRQERSKSDVSFDVTIDVTNESLRQERSKSAVSFDVTIDVTNESYDYNYDFQGVVQGYQFCGCGNSGYGCDNCGNCGYGCDSCGNCGYGYGNCNFRL